MGRRQKVEEAVANAVAMAIDALVAMVMVVTIVLDMVVTMVIIVLMALDVVAAVEMTVLGVTPEAESAVLKQWRHARSNLMELDIDGESAQMNTC